MASELQDLTRCIIELIMSKNKNNKHSPKAFHPESFHSPYDAINYAKKFVYMIVRGRKTVLTDSSETFNWITLGSGFLVGPNRLVSCAHVLNDVTKGDTAQHKAGDSYYFIKHDGEQAHWHAEPYELNKDIFIYPEIDLAVIHIHESFYKKDDNVLANPNEFLKIERNLLNIGTPIGVLGYPLCHLEFENKDVNQPKIGDVILRADTGVINAKFKTEDKRDIYQFTLSFNPGNSGGPIFNLNTGKVVSIVKGFNIIPLAYKEITLNEQELQKFKEYKTPSYIASYHTSYSEGFATTTFLERMQQHGI